MSAGYGRRDVTKDGVPLALRALPLMLAQSASQFAWLLRRAATEVLEPNLLIEAPLIFRYMPNGEYLRADNIEQYLPVPNCYESLRQLVEAIPPDWCVFEEQTRAFIDNLNIAVEAGLQLHLDPTLHGVEDLIAECPKALLTTITLANNEPNKQAARRKKKQPAEAKHVRWNEEAVEMLRKEPALKRYEIAQRIAKREDGISTLTVERNLNHTENRKKARLSRPA
ncbi:MAG: hypothetical protein AB7Q81_00060 [Gammaproteobacteria bacterium]